eukprot:788311-Rhodomonas_salina.1
MAPQTQERVPEQHGSLCRSLNCRPKTRDCGPLERASQPMGARARMGIYPPRNQGVANPNSRPWIDPNPETRDPKPQTLNPKP